MVIPHRETENYFFFKNPSLTVNVYSTEASMLANSSHTCVLKMVRSMSLWDESY